MLYHKNKFLGCLVGQGVGDATGTHLEFRPKGSFEPITDMIGGGPFNLKPGQFTDDHSMGMCLAASLIEKGFNPADQMHKYCMWRETGYMSANGRCFDIGITVSGALSRYKRTGNPYAGDTGRQTAGNGSLMRLAAIPIAYAYDPVLAGKMGGESSRTTHQAPQAIDACRFWAQLIANVLNGVTNVHACAESLLEFNEYDKEIVEAVRGAWAKPYSEIRGTGYVVKSLEAALYCFYHTNNFRDCILMASNLGDDADTTAAIAGQLAGAYYGLEGIPQSWREKLVMRIEAEQFAEELFKTAQKKMFWNRVTKPWTALTNFLSRKAGKYVA